MDLETETAELCAEASYLGDLINRLRELAEKNGYETLSVAANELANRLVKRKQLVTARLDEAMHEAMAVADAIMNCDDPHYGFCGLDDLK